MSWGEKCWWNAENRTEGSLRDELLWPKDTVPLKWLPFAQWLIVESIMGACNYCFPTSFLISIFRQKAKSQILVKILRTQWILHANLRAHMSCRARVHPKIRSLSLRSYRILPDPDVCNLMPQVLRTGSYMLREMIMIMMITGSWGLFWFKRSIWDFEGNGIWKFL